MPWRLSRLAVFRPHGWEHQRLRAHFPLQAGKLPSRWVVMARDKEDLGKLVGDLRWNSLKGDPRSRVWTDDYSSILTVFIWD